MLRLSRNRDFFKRWPFLAAASVAAFVLGGAIAAAAAPAPRTQLEMHADGMIMTVTDRVDDLLAPMAAAQSVWPEWPR